MIYVNMQHMAPDARNVTINTSGVFATPRRLRAQRGVDADALQMMAGYDNMLLQALLPTLQVRCLTICYMRSAFYVCALDVMSSVVAAVATSLTELVKNSPACSHIVMPRLEIPLLMSE